MLTLGLHVLVAATVMALEPCLSDPTPLHDFCVADLQAAPPLSGLPCKAPSTVVDDDFFSDVIVSPGSTKNPFGANTTLATVPVFPGLNTLGLSIARTNLAPSGMNPPHSHPRASKLMLVLKGEVMVGFTSSANRLYSKVVREGELFIVPRGLLHFQLNAGDGDAVFVAVFDSQSPGAVAPTFSLLASKPAMPMQVLARTFLMGEDDVSALKSKFAGF